jgi:hypothetical protein
VTAVDVPVKLDLVASLGADRVVDGTRVDFTREGARYDLILGRVRARCAVLTKPAVGILPFAMSV